jgi:hypothetical protein
VGVREAHETNPATPRRTSWSGQADGRADQASHRSCREARTVGMSDKHRNSAQPKFTPLQGQYIAFIQTYTLIHRRPPAERDMEFFFGVTPPAVHSMVLTLEARGLVERTPGKPRSLRVLLASGDVPALHEPREGK